MSNLMKLPQFCITGAPFLLGSTLMLVAIGFALSIDKDAGKGSDALEPLLGEDDTDVEAPLLAEDHIADLPLPNVVRNNVHQHSFMFITALCRRIL